MTHKKPKIVAFHVSKKSVESIKKDLRKQNFCGVSSMKSGRWFNVFYTHKKKKGKC